VEQVNNLKMMFHGQEINKYKIVVVLILARFSCVLIFNPHCKLSLRLRCPSPGLDEGCLACGEPLARPSHYSIPPAHRHPKARENNNIVKVGN
jgi:hypothetical protein